jgi:Kae1-associated kinase Bud32
MKEIGRGAEAVILQEDNADGTLCPKGSIHKVRPRKSYRLEEIDRDLRKRRTKAEGSILEKLKKAGVLVPQVLKRTDDEIVMEFVPGKQVKDVLDSDVLLSKKIGAVVRLLHEQDVVHGDLTTSNMIVKDGEICLIDFGLAYHSKRIEDKAVDVHLFLQALESKHFRVKDEAFRLFKEGYQSYAHSPAVLARLLEVEERGRYKTKKSA